MKKYFLIPIVLAAITGICLILKGGNSEAELSEEKTTIKTHHNYSVKQADVDPVYSENNPEKIKKSSLEDSTQPSKIKKNTEYIQYKAQEEIGSIGTPGKQKLDSPKDNVFHIYIDDITRIKTAYLNYDLYGLTDSKGVSRSINEGHAVGGTIITPDSFWKHQSEQISVKQLKEGDNVIRFSAYKNKKYGYAVRNVGISVYSGVQNNNETKICLEGLNNSFFGNTAYISGQITGNFPEGEISIFANGQQICYENGSFFGTITRNEEIKKNSWIIEITATNHKGWKVTENVHYKKANQALLTESSQDIIFTSLEADKGDTLTLNSGNASLHIDSTSSVTEKSTLSISTLREIDLMPTNAGLVNVTGNYAGYRMLPHGTRFGSPVRIGLPYDSIKIPQGYSEKDIRTYFFDEDKGSWIALAFDTIDTENHIAYALTTHFTDFINGIIEVPESPETQGYTPTSIKDLAVADPASGIMQIAAPSANNMGNANLSFPIKLSAGRQGMAPQLSVSYSSGGGDGWLGFGWSLSIPSISVETRWGVPRYDSDLETETYLMGGQLSPVAHRDDWENRTSDKQFFPRTEGSFSRIIRKGDNPTNYWWEVTTTSGMKFYYGSTDGENVSENHVLADGNGNIAEWKLAKQTDLNGNTITYTYQSPSYSSGPLSIGKTLYPESINYTGHDDEAGKYNVTFSLQNEIKTDARLSCNYGFPVSDGSLLDNIKVSYDGETIRSYSFDYTTGAYNKTLLQAITELDADNEEFYTNSFQYYNEVQDEGSYIPFKDAKTLSLPEDGLNGGDVLSLAKASAIGASKSTSVGAGIYVGIGYGTTVTSKVNTFGGSYNYNKSYSYGINTLIDLNGDHLPDKVFMDGDDLYYRPWETEKQNFGSAVKLRSSSNYQESESSSNTVGFSVVTAVGSIGASKRTTRTTTENYFSDVNSDGLVDFISDGKVYYNYLNEDGTPTFTRTLSSLLIPTSEEGEISEELLTPDYDDWEEEVGENPLNDIVRIWKAPYSGTVSINGGLSMIQSSEAYNLSSSDGIIARIQHNSNLIWTDSITAPYSGTLNPGTLTRTVRKGDRLFFRLQSNFNAMYDAVEWIPEVTYTNKSSVLDVNGLDYYSFSSSDAYLLSSPSGYIVPADGNISIRSYFNKPQTTDDITVDFILIDTLDSERVVYSRTFAWNEVFNDSIIKDDVAVEGTNENLYVKVSSKTNIDWAALQLSARFEYTSCTDEEFTLDALQANEYYTTTYYTTYNNSKGVASPVSLPNNKAIIVSPVRNNYQEIVELDSYPWYDTVAISGEFNLSVKRVDQSPAKKDMAIQDTAIGGDSLLQGPVSGDGDYLYFAIHTEDTSVFKALDTYVNVFWVDSTITGTMCTFRETDTTIIPGDFLLDTLRPYVLMGDTMLYLPETDRYLEIDAIRKDTSRTTAPAGVYCSSDYTIFGPLYRNWGQFSYYSDNDVINEDDLEAEECDENTDISIDGSGSYEDQEDSFESQGGTNPMTTPFIKLFASAETGRWTGYDDSVYVAKTVMSSSRRGEKDLIHYAQLKSIALTEATGKRGINKKNKNTSTTFSLSASVKGAGLSASTTDGSSETLTDFMDMNGDGYPDVINSTTVQYSSPLGSLTSLTADLGGYISESESESNGASLNGSVPVGKKNTANKNSISVAVGPGGASNSEKDNHTYFDINSDGLPDKVYDGGSVQLNLGYSFTEKIDWTFSGAVRESESVDLTANIGFKGIGIDIDPTTGELTGGSLQYSTGSGSFVAGIGASSNESHPNVQFMDINGDGLTDKVSTTNGSSPTTSAYLNTGVGFTDKISFDDLSTVYNQYSINAQMNVAFTFGFFIPIPFVGPIKFVFNPSVDASRGFNRTTESLMDFDGDGRPDYLTSSKEGSLQINYANYGKTNLLKQVDNALGSAITLDYEQKGNTFEQPNRMWTLSEVTIFDGHIGDGADYSRTTYEYGQGYYDRYERTFYGFDSLIAKQLDTENDDKIYRYNIKTFENRNFYTQGLQLTEKLFDGEGNLYTATENTYMFRKISDNSTVTKASLDEFSDGSSWFPYLAETLQLFYEGQEEAGKTYRNEFEYDEYGNITKYYDYGDENINDDIIIGEVTYHSDDDTYIHSTPASIEVTSGGTLYRKRELDIDKKGNISEIRKYITESEYALYSFEYDSYGNIIKKELPDNSEGQRMFYEYTYDDKNHSYITGVEDAFGYSASTEYDYRFGRVLSTFDINSQRMQYKYDSKGRLTMVTGPKEIENDVEFTILHTYHPFDNVPWALTQHYDPANPDDYIETAVFVDGLGRDIQIKKDAAIYQDSLSPNANVMVVSGLVEYDAFGRKITTYQPVVEEKGNTETFNTDIDPVTPTLMEYDAMNRKLISIFPDNSETSTSYSFDQDRNGKVQFASTITDALKHSTTQFVDIRKRKTSLRMPGDIWVSTVFDPVGQKIELKDPDGNTTSITYDMLGRRLNCNHPDAGVTVWTYDNAGNMLTNQSAHIELPITYSYDYNRLTDVTYPDNEYNNIHYEYGEAGADENRAGRIKTVEDGTGAQLFYYGNMGEIIQTTQAISVPDHGTYAFKTYWKYDSWNRIQRIIYPDGEELNYVYNSGGQLESMSGTKGLSEYKYVNRVGYDKFEQRLYISYGNGTQSSYTYDPYRRWLNNLITTTSSGRIIQNNSYTYDAVGNILQLTNSAGASSEDGDYGGPITHNYTYDERNQLVAAEGSYQSSENEYSYSLGMTYGNTGNVLSKSQLNKWKLIDGNSDDWTSVEETSYDYTYNYNGQKPHIVTSINNTSSGEDYIYQYDASGNNISSDEPGLETEKQLIWTEENRIAAIKSQGNVSHYIYNASGERTLKLHSNSLSISINGISSGVSEVNDDFSIYPNSYFVVNSGKYTKHFYVEGTRVLSKLGSDDVEELFYQGDDEAGTGDDDVDYSDKQDALESTVSSNMNSLGLTWYRNSNGEVPSKYIKNYLLALEVGNEVGSTSEEDESNEYESDVTDSLLASDPDYEVNQYYIHPDQLGSASFITDINGETYQHVEYLPFGETFVEERNSEQDQFTYLYNGKELDEATELYYYGARYYDPRTNIFLGVDPLAEKYPGLSPYSYCANNPIKYTDPDGKKIVLAGTRAQMQQTLATLQKLTDDKLNVNYSTGVVTIPTLSTGGSLSSGTALIRELNSKLPGARTVTIDNQNSTGVFSAGTTGNVAGHMPSADASNGTGVDAYVSFDPTSNPTIMTEDPTTGNAQGTHRPNEIGLGHELVHAYHYMTGTKGTGTTSYTYTDAAGNAQTTSDKTEEVNTVGIAGSSKYTENLLRQEQRAAATTPAQQNQLNPRVEY